MKLGPILLEELPEAERPRFAALADLEERLAAMLERGRRAWPALAVADEIFVRFVGQRLADDMLDPGAALVSLRPGDLLLACACTAGDEAAIGAFIAKYDGRIRSAVARAAPPDLVDEVTQRVHVKLFAPDGAIKSFAGRGDLGGWLQVLATREARTVLRGRRDQVEDPGEVALLIDRAVGGSSDPELELVKQRYREHFRAAFARAFARLTPRDRNLLRLEHIDGLDGEQIARLYDVHKATVSRWRAGARETLLRETRHYFEEELAVPRGEFDSIMRLIESQLHVSMHRLFDD